MQQILSKINGTITQKKVVSTSFILVRDLKLKKFRTIRQNSVLWARFLMFLLHQILRHISSSEFRGKYDETINGALSGQNVFFNFIKNKAKIVPSPEPIVLKQGIKLCKSAFYYL